MELRPENLSILTQGSWELTVEQIGLFSVRFDFCLKLEVTIEKEAHFANMEPEAEEGSFDSEGGREDLWTRSLALTMGHGMVCQLCLSL